MPQIVELDLAEPLVLTVAGDPVVVIVPYNAHRLDGVPGLLVRAVDRPATEDEKPLSDSQPRVALQHSTPLVAGSVDDLPL